MNPTDAVTLARTLMNNHGLGHWVFQWDRAKRRAGCCKHRQSMITLSYYYVGRNNEDDVKDTVLHEIAHALVGPKNGHNDIWKTVCVRIGAKPVRCYGNHVDMPIGRWQAQCNTCKKTFHRHRRPKYINSIYCMKCGPNQGKLSWHFLTSTPI